MDDKYLLELTSDELAYVASAVAVDMQVRRALRTGELRDMQQARLMACCAERARSAISGMQMAQLLEKISDLAKTAMEASKSA